MTSARHLVVSLPTARETPAWDARLAGVLALLRRRQPAPVVVVSAHPDRVRAAQPGVLVRPGADLAAALQGSEALLVTGSAQRDADFEAMARQVLTAQLLGIPAALVAVEMALPSSPRARAWLAEILAVAESVSAADAATATRLQALRGRRVETAAPPELVLEPAGGGRDGILVDASLQGPDGAALRTALADWQAAGVCTPHLPLPAGAANWRAWWNALSAAAVVVTDDPETAVCALACGTVPLLCGDAPAESPLVRVGLGGGIVPRGADAARWRQALEVARASTGRTLATRVAPLRAMAWRALGPLADATHARAWAGTTLSAPARALAAECCAAAAQSWVEHGEGPAAMQFLDAHAAVLEHEPAWARARARIAALLGDDAAAVERLQRALEQAPLDCETRAELARAQLRAGDPAAARRSWTELARLFPRDAMPWHELATLALLGGERDTALSCFHEALRRDPGHQGVRRAVEAYFAGDAAAAAAFWRRVPESAPAGPQVAGLQAPAV